MYYVFVQDMMTVCCNIAFSLCITLPFWWHKNVVSLYEFMKQAENKHTIVTPSPEYSLQVYIIPN